MRTDAEARAVVERARRAGEPIPPLGLLGGDLCRTLGGTGDEARLRSSEAMQLPVDLGAVLDRRPAALVRRPLVARKGWWRGRIFAAMNAEFLGRWDVAPRSHPNDGVLDTFDVTMPLGERLKARPACRPARTCPTAASRNGACRRLSSTSTGSTCGSTASTSGPARTLSIRVEPDALICVV